MIYLIKIIFLLIISYKVFGIENEINEILFKINNEVFTQIDLENRTEYVALINGITSSEFSKSENDEILEDYISSLIFYEFYIQNKIAYKNLNNEIDLLLKKNIQNTEGLNEEKIQIYKFNATIDLIRNKLIEERLNYRKNELLKQVDEIDLLYNYNLKNIIIKENLVDKDLIKNIDNRIKFNDLIKYLKENKIEFFYKEEDINDNSIISNKIKKIINQELSIYINKTNEYVNLIYIEKNLESYEGIFVKLINFKTSIPLKKQDLQCNNINESIDVNKTFFKEYEYSKLNSNIKNNLKSINDYVTFSDNDEFNYIILCDLTYDEKILKNINFNKQVNSLVNKIQKNFLKKYKDEYKFDKIK